MERIYSSELPAHVGERVLLAGWVHAKRDLGSVSFLVVRDRAGLAQPATLSVAQLAIAPLRQVEGASPQQMRARGLSSVRHELRQCEAAGPRFAQLVAALAGGRCSRIRNTQAPRPRTPNQAPPIELLTRRCVRAGTCPAWALSASRLCSPRRGWTAAHHLSERVPATLRRTARLSEKSRRATRLHEAAPSTSARGTAAASTARPLACSGGSVSDPGP